MPSGGGKFRILGLNTTANSRIRRKLCYVDPCTGYFTTNDSLRIVDALVIVPVAHGRVIKSALPEP